MDRFQPPEDRMTKAEYADGQFCSWLQLKQAEIYRETGRALTLNQTLEFMQNKNER